jgi:predicted nucleotidyltransferase
VTPKISVAKQNDDVSKIVKFFLEQGNKQYKIVKAYLYGSFTKGNACEWSDIDVAIISSDFSDDLFDERLNLMQMAASVDDRIETKPFKAELFDLDDPLVYEIIKNGIQFI